MNYACLLIGLCWIGTSCTVIEPTEQAEWQKETNGIWKYRHGDPAEIDLLKAAGAQPNLNRLHQFADQNFPLDTSEIVIHTYNGKTSVRLPLEADEQIYGLGLHFKTVHRRGKIYNLHVDHYGGRDDGRTHAPIPFYLSSKGYGVLINSARYVTAYIGTGVRTDSRNPPVVYNRNTDQDWDPQPISDAVELWIPDDQVELVLFTGASLLEVVQKYNLYSGGGVLPPKWGLGFTYRTHTLSSDQDVIDLVREFENRDFPLDFIGLEPGWMDQSYPCTYEWDTGRFADPEAFIDTLLANRVHTNLWMNPYIAPQAKLYEKLASYAGSHTVWNGIIPDYTLPGAQNIFLDFYQKEHLNIGVSGLKIDEVDGYDFWVWPDVATFPSGLEAEQMRQVYGSVIQRMIYQLYQQNNVRTYGLVRGTNAGTAYLPFVVYNDYYKHEDFITALINSGFIGVLWTPEARSSQTGEEWLRRMQSVCFSPMAMINAWASGTKPWSYPEVFEAVKSIAHLRMQLLPYVYSTFAEYHYNGIPPIRPMQLLEDFVVQDEQQKDAYSLATRQEIKDQYLFGANLLVAPVFAGQSSRTIILPKGNWYDFYTGKLVGNGELITIQAKLDQIPLFVKDGGIIPMIEKRLHAPQAKEKIKLIARHYGDSKGEFLLYDDDGTTFEFQKGAFSWTSLSVDYNVNRELVSNVYRDEKTIFGYNEVEWVFMTK